MFALSARYSISDNFSNQGPTARGEPFARQAEALLDKYNSEITSQPTLRILQGCILLACYHLSSGITSRAWYFTGLCSRVAYELDLHVLDREVINGSHVESPSEWVENEEKRRAWWSAWELDNFASTVSCRPYGFDRYWAEILLPVSDKDWFSGTHVASAPLEYSPLAGWQTLEDCPNQCERAWYLISVHLVRLSNEFRRGTGKDFEDFETGVQYFALALPPKFDVSSVAFGDGSNTGWIVCTHIMLQK